VALLAWSLLEFPDGYRKAGQEEYVRDAIQWGAHLFLKISPSALQG
jgi:hypothetical protein